MAKKVRKLHVKVKPVRLDGLPTISGNETAAKNLSTMVELKWKGPVSGFGLGLVPFYRSNQPVNNASSKPITMGVNHVDWEEEEFERVCCIVGPWNLSFNVFYGENIDVKNKKSLIGKASLDLSELASKLDSTVERKLRIRSKGSLLSKEATLVVNLTFSEVRNETVDFTQFGQISIDSAISTKMKTRRSGSSDLDLSFSPATTSSSGGRSPAVENDSSSSPEENQSEPVHKAGFNWWKRRRLSFSVTWRREPREDDVTKISSKPSETESETPVTELSIEPNKWLVKDLMSRDGKSKLKSEVYMASIDQRSEEAAGEAACATVAVVVAHWFHANPKLINPSGTEFDSLITQGSSLWQSLCDKESYLRLFPNKHFDLETIVSANLRPIKVSTEKSFTGFFSPERFGSLEGLMSFDQIWDEVEKEVAFASGEIRVYIISWNDHFFVVKADSNGYCVIDSLGERLFEGCNQAYILKFDDSSLMYEKYESSEKLVCEGKECCREYIKRFLAAIPVTELAAKEEKGDLVDVSLLHEKLQIDLHHIMLTSDE